MTTLLNYSSKSLKQIMQELYGGQYIFEEKYCENVCKNVKHVFPPYALNIRNHWRENIIIYQKCRYKPSNICGYINVGLEIILNSNLVLNIEDDKTIIFKSRFFCTPHEVTKDDLDFIWSTR